MDFLLWKELSEAQINKLADAFEPAECRRLLADNLCLEPPTESGDSKADLIIDYFFYNYAFCKDHGLPANKVSTFLSLMKSVIDHDCSSQRSSSDSMTKSYKRFEDMLMRHSVERPPYSIGVFNEADAAAIVDHATNHYFRNYKLYQYIFTENVRSTVEQKEVGGVEVPRVPRTLSDAMGMNVVVTWPEPVEEDDDDEEEEGGTEEEGGEEEGEEWEEKKEGGED